MDEQPNSESEQVPAEASTPEPATPSSAMSDILPPIKPKHILGGLLKVLLILIIIAALAGGAFWLVSKHKSTKPASTAAPNSTSSSSATTASSATKIASATKHYDSTTYSLGFDYPNDWTVNDTPDKLTVTSPGLQLKDSTGQEFTGEIVLTIQNQQTSVAQFAANKAVAALESQKITYTKPTPNQRAQTYVSFVSYAGLTSVIDALYIAGDNGYQAGQSIPQSDVIQADPLVTISFLKCSDSACKTTPTATTIQASSWANASLSKPLITMLESLVID